MSACPTSLIKIGVVVACLYMGVAMPVQVIAEEVKKSSTVTAVEKAERKLPSMEKFVTELEKLLVRYYPGIKRGNDSNDPKVVMFEFDTMKFMIHHPLKTGEWQPAREQLGPNRHGVICGIRLNEGRYAGAAVLPQVFDNRYFNTLSMAPYSVPEDCHLHASLSYPEHNVDPNFLREYQRLVNDFARYLN